MTIDMKGTDIPDRVPTTQTIKASDARQRFSELINKVFRRETRVIVEKSGIPVAAIISAQDLELLKRLEAEHEREFAILKEIGEAFRDVAPEEIEREVSRAIAEARAENRRLRRAKARTV